MILSRIRKISPDIRPGDVVIMTYKNWKERIAKRTFRFESVGVYDVFQDGELHLTLNGIDEDKRERRSYHVNGIELGSVEVYREVATRVELRSEDGRLLRVEEVSYPSEYREAGIKEGSIGKD